MKISPLIAVAVTSQFFMVSSVQALPASSFTCEKIKEKAVRQACVQDRIDREKTESAEKEKIAAAEAQAERDKQVAEKKAKEEAEFLRLSKEAITKNFKDPYSAQFTDLLVAESENGKLLCGKVNAKNSYGGYVGAKKFYVKWVPNAEQPEAWMEGDWAAWANTKLDDLNRRSSSPGTGLAEKIRNAEEGDTVVAKAKREEIRAAKIMTEECVPRNKNATASILQ